MDWPQQLSEETYMDVSKRQLFDCGTPYQSKSAPMVLIGSTIGATGDPYRYKRPDGSHGILPRLLVESRHGKPAFNALHQPWVMDFARQAHEKALAYAHKHSPEIAAEMRDAIEKIPGELRVCGTAFTALAVIGDGTDGMNHPHLDDHEERWRLSPNWCV